jgi:hypothetical protein
MDKQKGGSKKQNVDREQKEDPKKVSSEILKNKKTDAETGQKQYPAKMGYHGTDEEKNLNPEE